MIGLSSHLLVGNLDLDLLQLIATGNLVFVSVMHIYFPRRRMLLTITTHFQLRDLMRFQKFSNVNTSVQCGYFSLKFGVLVWLGGYFNFPLGFM